MANSRINSDWQFRCAPLSAGYAERYDERLERCSWKFDMLKKYGFWFCSGVTKKGRNDLFKRYQEYEF